MTNEPMAMKLNFGFITLFLILLLFPLQAEAAGIGFGFNTWYAGWMPGTRITYPFLPPETEYAYIPFDNKNRIKICPNVMFGPSMHIIMPYGLSIHLKMLFGQFSAKKKNDYFLNFIIFDNVGMIKRFDTDSMLCYSLNDLMNIFIGFKYNHYQFVTLSYSRSISGFYAAAKKEIKNKTDEYLPLLGIGASIPIITDKLALNIDAAFLFCISITKTRQYFFSGTEMTSVITYFPPLTEKCGVKKMGLDAHCDLTYRIPVVLIDLSLGFRYQMLKILSVQKDNSLLYEHRYGVFASVNYTFNFK